MCTNCISTVNESPRPVSYKFQITTGSAIPIYRQITDQVRMAVAIGKLGVGDPLPSVRTLAEELVVNPNTVARAYSDLGREGLLEARQGLGVFIAPKRRVYTREEASRRMDPLLNGIISEAVALGYSFEELREAFERKLSKWTEPKGANDE
jgi:GntR family transcriptional regulator